MQWQYRTIQTCTEVPELQDSLMLIVRYNIRSKDDLCGDEYSINRSFFKPRMAL